MKKSICAAVCLVSLALGLAVGTEAQSYTAVDLGPGVAYAINDSGQSDHLPPN